MATVVFPVQWLNDSFLELEYPNPVLERVTERLMSKLTKRVKKSGLLDDPVKKQIYFSLLGSQYVKEYFTFDAYDPQSLALPHMKPEVKYNLRKEMKAYLMHTMDEVCEDLGLYSIGMLKQDPDLMVYSGKAQDSFKKHFNDQVLLTGSKDKVIYSTLTALLKWFPVSFPEMKQVEVVEYLVSMRVLMWEELFLIPRALQSDGLLNKEERRDSFTVTVESNLEELGVDHYINNPESKRIVHQIIDVYHKMELLSKRYKADDHHVEAFRVLNFYFMYSKTFDTQYVYWLCPLQLALKPVRSDDDDEHLLQLAVQLDSVLKFCKFDWPVVNSLADNVSSRLHKLDPDLFDGVAQAVTVNVQIQPNDFLSAILEEEGYDVAIPSSDRQEFKADVSIGMFIKKWLSEAFASVLRPDILLFVWDRFFITEWNEETTMNVCLSLFGLLRPWFIDCANYADVRKVFIERPADVEVSDMKRALEYLADGKSLADIGEFNVQYKKRKESLSGPVDASERTKFTKGKGKKIPANVSMSKEQFARYKQESKRLQ